jgi:sirohydrochlorin cobaltochelatase
MPAKPALKAGTLLFAHGSRDPLWRAPIEAVAERMRALAPDSLVLCAYLELTAPDLRTATQALLDQGASHITVWPMFLGVGRHVREDLPVLLTELRQRHPGITFSLQPAIGEHPNVLEAMAQTALNTLKSADC